MNVPQIAPQAFQDINPALAAARDQVLPELGISIWIVRGGRCAAYGIQVPDRLVLRWGWGEPARPGWDAVEFWRVAPRDGLGLGAGKVDAGYQLRAEAKEAEEKDRKRRLRR